MLKEKSVLLHNSKREVFSFLYQFLITGGEPFFHEEWRDRNDETQCIESNTLGYQVTTSDREDRQRLMKQIISDLHRLLGIAAVGAQKLTHPAMVGEGKQGRI